MFSTERSSSKYAAILATLVCTWAGAAQASKLDDITCDALKLEKSRLETEALKSDMAKGPQWAKDNLSTERLKEIEQLIGLQATVAFRCPRPKPPPVQAGTAKKAGQGVAATKLDDEGAPIETAKQGGGPKPAVDATTGTAGEAPQNGETAKKPKSTTSKTQASKTNKNKVGSGGPQVDNPAAAVAAPSSKKKDLAQPAKPAASAQKSKTKVKDAFVPPPAAGVAPGLTPPQPAPAPQAQVPDGQPVGQ